MNTVVAPDSPELLNARQVQLMLAVDRSTVYRMAQDGRLPALRIGHRWRFPSDRLRDLIEGPMPTRPEAPPVPVPEPIRSADAAGLPVSAVEGLARAAGALLGVMIVVTDLTGHPVCDIVNPCPWFVAHAHDANTLAACVKEWRQFAEDVDLVPHFRLNGHGFECARALIRSGSTLVGMVLAGGVASLGSDVDGLDVLDDDARARVLAGLGRLGAVLSELVTGPGSSAE